MPLREEEKQALDSIRQMLNEDVELGLSKHKDDPYIRQFDGEHGFQFNQGKMSQKFMDMIDGKFGAFQNAVQQAYANTKSYKYLDDPSFLTAMNNELVSQAVPARICAEVAKIYDKLYTSFKGSDAEYAERDSGFNPDLDEVVRIPDQPSDFKMEDDGGFNDGNVESEIGEASPGHTPDDK
jgi:hypothetical protein